MPPKLCHGSETLADQHQNAWLTRGLRHHQSGEIADAESCYRTVLREAPDHAQANHLLGVLAGQTGQTDLAVRLLERARTAEPGDPAIHNHLGNILKESGRLDHAAESYRTAITVDPSFHPARFNLGNTLMLRDQFDQAAACYRQVLIQEPDDPEVLNNLGCALRRSGALDESAVVLRRAVDLNPEFAAALHNLGATFLDLARYGEALDWIRRSLVLSPDDPNTLRSLGNALLALNRVADAESAYRRSLSACPDSAESWNNLGIVLQELRRIDEALQCFNRAAALNPADPEYHNNRGIIFTRLERYHEAQQTLKQAFQLDPDYFPTCGNLGTCAMEQGRLDEATEWFHRAIRSALRRGRRTLNGKDRISPMDTGLARTALLDLKVLLDKHSIPFFLCFGTLLGCVREGDFLPGDKDVDVGVFDDIPRERLRAILGGSQSHADRVLTTAHRNGVTIDVFVHAREGGYVDVGTEHPVDPIRWRFSAFDLAPREFVGASFLAPQDAPRYLSEMYGPSWEIPDPFFDGLIHSPAIQHGSERLSLCYACNRLLNALCKANHKKVAVYAKALVRMDPASVLYRELLTFAELETA